MTGNRGNRGRRGIDKLYPGVFFFFLLTRMDEDHYSSAMGEDYLLYTMVSEIIWMP